MDIVESNLRPFIKQWAKDNESINIKILAAHLIAAVTDFGGTFSDQPVLIPTW